MTPAPYQRMASCSDRETVGEIETPRVSDLSGHEPAGTMCATAMDVIIPEQGTVDDPAPYQRMASCSDRETVSETETPRVPDLAGHEPAGTACATAMDVTVPEQGTVDDPAPYQRMASCSDRETVIETETPCVSDLAGHEPAGAACATAMDVTIPEQGTIPPETSVKALVPSDDTSANAMVNDFRPADSPASHQLMDSGSMEATVAETESLGGSYGLDREIKMVKAAEAVLEKATSLTTSMEELQGREIKGRIVAIAEAAETSLDGEEIEVGMTDLQNALGQEAHKRLLDPLNHNRSQLTLQNVLDNAPFLLPDESDEMGVAALDKTSNVGPVASDGTGNVNKAEMSDEENRVPKGTVKGTAKSRSSKKKAEDDDEKSTKYSDMLVDEQETLRGMFTLTDIINLSSLMRGTTEKGEKEINMFLTKDKPITFSIRRHIRDTQEFLPRAATTSRKLALHILGTNRGSVICIFHQRNRSFSATDGFKNKYVVTGVAYPKQLNSASAKHTPPAGHLHCGCNIDVVLTSFFFWKTWTVRSFHPKIHIIESMRDDFLHPRHRAFIVEAFQKATCLTIDDMYGEYGPGSAEYERRIRLLQVTRLLEKVNALNRLEGLPEQKLVDSPSA
jgi:hypothetical protein